MSRHAQDYASRPRYTLPHVIVQAAIPAYRNGEALQPLSRRLRVHWKSLRNALTEAGVPIRSVGWPKGRKHEISRVLVPWEARLARAEAQDRAREAARLARLTRRCECGGRIRPGVAHHCGRGM